MKLEERAERIDSEASGEQIRHFHQVVDLKKDVNLKTWAVLTYLLGIKDDRFYKQYGYVSFQSFIQDPEINILPSFFNKIKRIKSFLKKLGFKKYDIYGELEKLRESCSDFEKVFFVINGYFGFISKYNFFNELSEKEWIKRVYEFVAESNMSSMADIKLNLEEELEALHLKFTGKAIPVKNEDTRRVVLNLEKNEDFLVFDKKFRDEIINFVDGMK